MRVSDNSVTFETADLKKLVKNSRPDLLEFITRFGYFISIQYEPAPKRFYVWVDHTSSYKTLEAVCQYLDEARRVRYLKTLRAFDGINSDTYSWVITDNKLGIEYIEDFCQVIYELMGDL